MGPLFLSGLTMRPEASEVTSEVTSEMTSTSLSGIASLVRPARVATSSQQSALEAMKTELGWRDEKTEAGWVRKTRARHSCPTIVHQAKRPITPPHPT